MSDQPRIEFQETESDAAELLREMGAPGLKKNASLPPHVADELRRHQVRRLEENVAVLRRKQEEFHRKMEEYIASLRAVIENLRRQLDARPEAERSPASGARREGAGTHVRCIGCGAEEVFDDVEVLFAREPDDLFARPIEVIVHRGGKLAKGTFRCPRCGDCNLSIRPHQPREG